MVDTLIPEGGSAKPIFKADADALKRATLQEQTKEMRYAIKGLRGYKTEWPRRRATKSVRASRRARGEKPSIQTWRFKAQTAKSKMYTEVRNMQRHGHLLEVRDTLRGYRNKHYRKGLITLRKNWKRMSAKSQARAPERVQSNMKRAFHAKKAAAARAAKKQAQIQYGEMLRGGG